MAKDKKKIVAKFDKANYYKIEFYNVLFAYKEYTILERQTFDLNRYYIYDNKTKTFGKLHLIKAPDLKVIKFLLRNERIEWFNDDILFFWADSRIVTEYGLPKYESLVHLYKHILDIRKMVRDEQSMLGLYKAASITDFIVVYFKLTKHKIRRNRFLKEAKKELNIIW